MNLPSAPVVESVYLLDDLSGLVRECAVTAGLESAELADLLAHVRRTALAAAAALPLGSVRVDLLTWEHVLESLRARLGRGIRAADTTATLVLGDGGSRLATELNRWGCALPGRVDVPVAKVLDEPDNAFYSPHRIGQRDLGPLTVTGSVPRDGVLVVDDCVQTGMTFDEVVAAAGVHSGTVVTGICNEATLYRLDAAGWQVVYGVLLPGPTYPDSYSTDLFCVRDFVVTDAVRFADGSSTSYSSGGDWLDVLYGDPVTADSVRAGWQELAGRLSRAGVKP